MYADIAKHGYETMQPTKKKGPKSIYGQPFECDKAKWQIEPMTDLDRHILQLCSMKVKTSRKDLTIHFIFSMRLHNKNKLLEENIEKHIVKIHLRYSADDDNCYALYEDMAFTTKQRLISERARIDITKRSFRWIPDKNTKEKSDVVGHVYGCNNIPCRIFEAVQQRLQAVDVKVEHNQDIGVQPALVPTCNIAALLTSIFPNLLTSDNWFCVIQCFKFHRDLQTKLGTSNNENTAVLLLLLQLLDLYMFNTYGGTTYVDAKNFCDVNETKTDDPLHNAVCNYCKQSDNPDKWYDCENSQCGVAYHKLYCYEKAEKKGYFSGNDDDDEWFCSEQCKETQW
jgi:hypothetical protein